MSTQIVKENCQDLVVNIIILYFKI